MSHVERACAGATCQSRTHRPPCVLSMAVRPLILSVWPLAASWPRHDSAWTLRLPSRVRCGELPRCCRPRARLLTGLNDFRRFLLVQHHCTHSLVAAGLLCRLALAARTRRRRLRRRARRCVALTRLFLTCQSLLLLKRLDFRFDHRCACVDEFWRAFCQFQKAFFQSAFAFLRRLLVTD